MEWIVQRTKNRLLQAELLIALGAKHLEVGDTAAAIGHYRRAIKDYSTEDERFLVPFGYHDISSFEEMKIKEWCYRRDQGLAEFTIPWGLP